MKALMNRAALKGEKLKGFCYKVRTHHIIVQDKNGMYHDLNFCYGNGSKCRACKAYIDYKDEWVKKVRSEKG